MPTTARNIESNGHSRGAHDAGAAGGIDQTFLTGLAHDLRQVLTVIHGTTVLTERRLTAAGTPLDTIARALSVIRDAATRMELQITELEHFAVGEPDQAPGGNRRSVDLVAIAHEAAARHAAISDRHRFSVVVGTPEGGIVGHWDAMRLERALDNLVGNAIKFSPTGGNITLTVGREAGADPEVAVLQVRDEGIGIPARDLPHVFECFRRAKNATNTIPGTGVGLAVVRDVIEQHGGTIEAASKLGRGATFTLRLPLVSPLARP